MSDMKVTKEKGAGRDLYPVLPLRDIVVFPYMIVPLFVGREKSINALEEVMRSDKHILLAAQKNAGDDDPATDAIYEMGTLASVLQLLKLPDGTVKVLVEGTTRARIVRYTDNPDFFEAEVERVTEEIGNTRGNRGAGPFGGVPVRELCEAQQEDLAGSAGYGEPDRGLLEARRHHCLAPGHQDRRQAADPRDHRHLGSP